MNIFLQDDEIVDVDAAINGTDYNAHTDYNERNPDPYLASNSLQNPESSYLDTQVTNELINYFRGRVSCVDINKCKCKFIWHLLIHEMSITREIIYVYKVQIYIHECLLPRRAWNCGVSEACRTAVTWKEDCQTESVIICIKIIIIITKLKCYLGKC